MGRRLEQDLPAPPRGLFPPLGRIPSSWRGSFAGAAREREARERARMALINIIVFAARQECRREWEDDTVESSGGGPAFILLQAPLIPNNGTFIVRSDGERAPTKHVVVLTRIEIRFPVGFECTRPDRDTPSGLWM